MLISVPGYIDSLGDCQARDDIKNSIGMYNNMVKITFLEFRDIWLGVDSDNKTNIIVADFLLAMQTKSGNFPCAMDEAPPNPTRHENEELVHWCHGAPGISIFTKKILVFFGIFDLRKKVM